MAEEQEQKEDQLSQLDRLAKHPIAPPADPDAEATDANPVPLSPTEPRHRTTDGTKNAETEPGVVAVPAMGAGGGVTTGGASAMPAVPIIKEDRTPTE
jgi:hypothetical protein